MKVLLINGSPNRNGCTNRALEEVEKSLREEKIDTEIFQIGNGPVHGCSGCNACEKTGRCIHDDDPANKMLNLMKEADGIVIGTPVYYSGANGALCALLDRIFYAGGNELAGKPAAAVVSARRSGTTAAFQRINQYFAIKKMPLSLHSIGIMYTVIPRRMLNRIWKGCRPCEHSARIWPGCSKS